MAIENPKISEIEEIETQTYRTLSEFRTLKNKLKRYWKKLAKASLEMAKSSGLEIRVTENPVIYQPGEIVVFDNYGDCGELNDTNLLKSAKPYYLSLYRKYQDGLEKYDKLRQKLKELDAKIGNIVKQQY